MKKTLLWIMVLLLSLSLFATFSIVGCEKAGEGVTAEEEEEEEAAPAVEEEEEEETKEPVTLTLMASVDWIQEAEYDLAQKFTDQTGNDTDYQIVPSDQYPNLLQTKLNSGECTDIFCSQAGRFDIVTILNVEKNAVDLSGEAWVGTMDETAAAEVSVNGKAYGQPLQDVSAVWGIAYNKKIFSELELSIPKTWSEFMAVCEAIKASGVTPIYEPVSDGWHHVLWFCEMGGAFEEAEPGLVDKLNNNQLNLADSVVLKTAIDQIKEMVDKGYWGNNYMADAYSDQQAKIASGEYAMSVANQGLPQLVADLDQGLTVDDIGFFVMPIVDNQLLNVNPVGPTRFVYSGSENIDAAKQYLAFLAEPENLQYMIDNVAKFQNLPYSGVTSKYAGTIKEFYDTYTDKGTVLQTAVKYVNPKWMDIGKEIVTVIQGSEDATKMLENMDKNRGDQAQAANDPAWQ
jgi:raffinose/stachyose/melibiose transport system substrate-binding protein